MAIPRLNFHKTIYALWRFIVWRTLWYVRIDDNGKYCASWNFLVINWQGNFDIEVRN
jgi:hypothetical protein